MCHIEWGKLIETRDFSGDYIGGSHEENVYVIRCYIYIYIEGIFILRCIIIGEKGKSFKKTLFSTGYLYSGGRRISNVIRPTISNPVPGDETSVIGKRHETGCVTDWRVSEGSKEKAISSFHYSRALFLRSFLIQSRCASWLNTRCSDHRAYIISTRILAIHWWIKTTCTEIKLNRYLSNTAAFVYRIEYFLYLFDFIA